jgi:N-acetylneuraminate synthase
MLINLEAMKHNNNQVPRIDINKLHLIAEIGINHNGDLNIAKKLIENAKKVGFHSVKFQKRTLSEVYTKEFLNSPRESPWGNTQFDQKNGLEFEKDQYDKIDAYCKKLNIHWFASAWDIKSLEFLDQYKLIFNKVASAMIVDKKFLDECAKRKIYTFISTGMSSEKNIDEAVEIFEKNNCRYELMHCVSSYPAKLEDLNLKTIQQLQKKYNCKVGYSSHENGVVVSASSVLYGITSLEKHITLDRTMYGSDQAASIEFNGMQNLCQSIEKILISAGEASLGKITKDEEKIAEKLRAHIKI